MNKPIAKDYQTNDGMHAAMRVWALSQSKPTLRVRCQWSDSGDVYTDTFEPCTKEVPYKTPDGETYYQTVDTGKYEAFDSSEEMTSGLFKKHVAKWLISADPDVEITKLVWY